MKKQYKVDTRYAKVADRKFRIYGNISYQDKESGRYYSVSFYDLLADENNNPRLKNYQSNLGVTTPEKMAANLVFFFQEVISLLRHKFNLEITADQLSILKEKQPSNPETEKICKYEYKLDDNKNLERTWEANFHVDYGEDHDIFLEPSMASIDMDSDLKVRITNLGPNLAIEDLTGFAEDMIVFLAQSVLLLEDRFINPN